MSPGVHSHFWLRTTVGMESAQYIGPWYVFLLPVMSVSGSLPQYSRGICIALMFCHISKFCSLIPDNKYAIKKDVN